MPYFRDPNLDNKDKDQTGGVQLGSSDNPADPSNIDSGGSQTSSKSSPTGSHFQNLDSYITNNDAQGFGQKFGQNVQNSIDQARNTIDTTTNQVKGQINGGANPASQQQINTAVQNAGTGTTPEQEKQYQDWTTQTYQGPHSLSDNAGAQNQIEGGVSAAQAKARLAGSEAGRFSLLDQYYGRPSYNFGQKSLDNLLVERGGGFNNPQQYQNQASQLGAYEDQQRQAIQEAASQRAGQIDQSRQQARSAIGLQDDNTIKGGAIGDFQTGLDARVAQQNAARDQDWQLLQSNLSGTQVPESVLARTDLTAGERLYDLNTPLNDPRYLTKGTDASRTNVANGSDYARYAALAQMAGINPTYLTPDQQANAGNALKPTGNTFNTALFNSDLEGAKADYNQALAQDSGAKQPFGTGAMTYGQLQDFLAQNPNHPLAAAYAPLLNAFNGHWGRTIKTPAFNGLPGDARIVTGPSSGGARR